MKMVVAVVCLGAMTCFAGTAVASSAKSGVGARARKAGQTGAKIKPHDFLFYDNGPDDGMNAYTINSGYSVTNSFTVPPPPPLGFSIYNFTSVTFSNWLNQGDTGVAVDWLITSEPFGVPLLSGSSLLTGVFEGTNSLGYDVYEETFSLDTGLNAFGPFYLQLENEVTALDGPGYWGESNGPSFACQEGNGLTCDNNEIPSEAFSISGDVRRPIPEPGSWVLLGTGLLGMAGAVRGKMKF